MTESHEQTPGRMASGQLAAVGFLHHRTGARVSGMTTDNMQNLGIILCGLAGIVNAVAVTILARTLTRHIRNNTWT